MQVYMAAGIKFSAVMGVAVFFTKKDTMNYTESKFDINNIGPRITTKEVCKLARIGKGKLRRYIRTGKFPKPVDRGGEGYIWNTASVFDALGISRQTEADINPWEMGLE